MDKTVCTYEDELGLLWTMEPTEDGMIRFYMPSADCEFEDPDKNGYYFDTEAEALLRMYEWYGKMKLVMSCNLTLDKSREVEYNIFTFNNNK